MYAPNAIEWQDDLQNGSCLGESPCGADGTDLVDAKVIRAADILYLRHTNNDQQSRNRIRNRH